MHYIAMTRDSHPVNDCAIKVFACLMSVPHWSSTISMLATPLLPPIVGLGTKTEKSELERLSITITLKEDTTNLAWLQEGKEYQQWQTASYFEKGTPWMPWCDSMKYKMDTETVFPEWSINIGKNALHPLWTGSSGGPQARVQRQLYASLPISSFRTTKMYKSVDPAGIHANSFKSKSLPYKPAIEATQCSF